MKHILIISLFALFLIGCQEKPKEVTSSKNYLKEGEIQLIDKELLQVLNPKNKLEILSEGHDWTEGPLWIENEQMLLFSDIPRNTVYAWQEKTGTKKYLKPSGYTGEVFDGSEPGSNGLLLNPKGELILCQHGDRKVVRMNGTLKEPQSDFIEIVGAFEGKRLNSPNDAIYDSKGRLYFTDPPYGLPKQMDDPKKELGFQGVYLLDTNGLLQLIDADLTRPNGIALSPDESTLYVANSDPDRPIWMVYKINDQGLVISKKEFFNAADLVKTQKGLPDGLKVHQNGYLFATGPGGIFVFNSEAKHLGTIKTGQATSNVAFNADQSALFITADSYVLRLELN